MRLALDGRHLLLAVMVGTGAVLARAEEFERPPIAYSESTPSNCVSELQQKLESGEAALAYDERTGYLRALLEALEVPVESQMLVFSKTSLQRHRISPKTPRAIYFNDQVYIGFCQSGDVLEVTAVDPQLGAVFYTLDQHAREAPRFVRQTDNCLICHSSSRTDGVPGHVVRSVFANASGEPIFSAGGFTVDHTTPFSKRWGGWYVTGQHGEMEHLGNLVINGSRVPQPLDNAQGQNVTDLSDRLSLDGYLAPHSDLVALMVFEHQTLVHNRLTRANFAARQALHYQQEMARALGEPDAPFFESTRRRIESAGDDLVEALLMSGEAELSAPVRGTSKFADVFQKQGVRDECGRSLRDLDLEHRLFRYPCSYLIYSNAFDALPEAMREYVWRRLWAVLAEGEGGKAFSHLSDEDRRAVLEILIQTRPGLPDYWKDPASQTP